VGKTYDVIADKISRKSSEEILGVSSEDLMILFDGEKKDFGKILSVKCTGLKGNTLFGEIII
jgi:tRNA A37 methylthiotransferase MiaB